MTSHRPRLTPEQKAILDLITARLSITDLERVAELESAAAEILDIFDSSHESSQTCLMGVSTRNRGFFDKLIKVLNTHRLSAYVLCVHNLDRKGYLRNDQAHHI